MKTTFLAVAALLAGATVLAAQAPKPEIRPFGGAMIPTGDQRALFDDAALIGVQAAVEVKPSLHLVGTFSWSPGQEKYPVGLDDVNIFQYTVGIELGFVQPLAGAWELRPFVGLGAGGRTYAYAADALSGKTCSVGYGAVGTEFQIGRTALRVEARDNLFCFRSPVAGEDAATRNDLAFSLGLAYHFR